MKKKLEAALQRIGRGSFLARNRLPWLKNARAQSSGLPLRNWRLISSEYAPLHLCATAPVAARIVCNSLEVMRRRLGDHPGELGPQLFRTARRTSSRWPTLVSCSVNAMRMSLRPTSSPQPCNGVLVDFSKPGYPALCHASLQYRRWRYPREDSGGTAACAARTRPYGLRPEPDPS